MSLTTFGDIAEVPSQMKSYYDKTKDKKKWGKECMDAFDSIGRRQYRENLRFYENYQMLNGKFFWHHYYDQEGYKDWLTLLTQQLDLPSTLRHYDIIGKVVNNLTEKWSEMPDSFRVEEKYDNNNTNEYTRDKTELMHIALKAEINAEIKKRLIQEGFDPDRKNFDSEETAMQYYQEMQQAAQAKSFPEIQTYMNTTWQSQAEIWGMGQIENDRINFKLPELERVEFKDMLTSDRCFRHYYITGNDYNQETWNPLNTFYHNSPEVIWVEEGDYVGRSFYYTKSDIFNRYGWKLKKDDIKKLDTADDDDVDSGRDMTGFPYKVYAPFEDYKSYYNIVKTTGYDPLNRIPVLPDDEALALRGGLSALNNPNGLYRVIEVYWKSLRKLGKVVYIDPLTGRLTKDMVDENFVVPEGFKQVQGDYLIGNNINTVYWTWVPEVWQGTKICMEGESEDAIYLDMEPIEFQFKGDSNPFGARLPVCGRTFNGRNAQSMSLVDLMKPHQIGYNVAMNQLYQLMEKEIGKFYVWDAAFFNNMKDWGGEDSWEKVALVAKELGHVFGDSSPRNLQGANAGNQLPKEINAELTAQLFSRAKLADFFESKAMAQIGVSRQFIADVDSSETATGVNTAVNQTQLNVQKYYTDFLEYKQRCYTMGLDISQYVQSQKDDPSILYTKSDGNREFIKTTGINLLLSELYVFVVNSQELLKQLETIKQLYINRNQTDISDVGLIEIIRANSPAQLQLKLQEIEDKKNAREQQNITLQQQQIEQTGQIADKKMAQEKQIADDKNAKDIKVAEIQTFGGGGNETVPQDNSVEYDKLSSVTQNNNDKIAVQRENNQLSREKISSDSSLKAKELELKKMNIKQKEKESKDKVKIAIKNKGKYDK